MSDNVAADMRPYEREKPLVSVVVPAYNEEDVIGPFYERLVKVFENLGDVDGEFIFVNDGSRDKTLEILSEMREKDPRICIVDLSRNFGKEIAMTAGLDSASGNAVVVIDADLQDPPELIAEFVKFWREGFDVVYAKRRTREGETFMKKFTARAFYRVMQRLGVDMPRHVGDFRLLSRRAVDALLQLRERHRFMKGLFAWIGYPSKAVIYDRDPRYAGETKWNYWKLWNFAIEGITGFTTLPLRVATYIGAGTAIFAFCYGIVMIARTIIFGNPVPGYPSLMVVVLFLGGIQLITMGIFGEYLGRLFNEVKGRPLYLLKGFYPSHANDRRKAPR